MESPHERFGRDFGCVNVDDRSRRGRRFRESLDFLLMTLDELPQRGLLRLVPLDGRDRCLEVLWTCSNNRLELLRQLVVVIRRGAQYVTLHLTTPSYLEVIDDAM